jgi:rubrerythrin
MAKHIYPFALAAVVGLAAAPVLGQPQEPIQAEKPSIADKKAQKERIKAAKKKARAARRAQVYVCPLGCYTGRRTPNGRCPECGTRLQKQK